MPAGLLISFEGIDGCGKSTQLDRLATRLRAAGVEPLLLREPGGTPLGERLRELLLDPQTGDIAPAAEALLYAASRAELVTRVIEPALAAGRIVLLDRYVDSSLAYQGAGRGLGIERVLEANLLATGGRMPDRTILLELDPEQAARRLDADGADPDRLEAAGGDFFDRVRGAYADLAERFSDRIMRIDASDEPALVERRVAEQLDPLLRSAGHAVEPLPAGLGA